MPALLDVLAQGKAYPKATPRGAVGRHDIVECSLDVGVLSPNYFVTSKPRSKQLLISVCPF